MPQPTDVKFFRFDQPGAPQITNTAGALIGVLDACLVNGWGLVTLDSLVVDSDGVATATRSAGHAMIPQGVVEIAGATPDDLNAQHKVIEISATTFKFKVDPTLVGTATGTITAKVAPAGWEKAYSGTNIAAYRSLDPASSKCFLRVDATDATYSKIRGYESMTDVDTGSGLFPTVDQVATPVWTTFYLTGTPKNWFVVSDSRMFYIGVASYQNTGVYLVGCFGDIVPRKPGDAYGCVIRMTSNSAAAGSYDQNASVFYNTISNQYLARDVTGLGAAIAYDFLYFGSLGGSPTASGNGSVPYPNPANGELLLSAMECAENGAKTYRGTLPGIFYSVQLLRDKVSGGPTAWSMLDVADLPGRKILAVPFSYTPSSSFYVGFIDTTGPWR